MGRAFSRRWSCPSSRLPIASFLECGSEVGPDHHQHLLRGRRTDTQSWYLERAAALARRLVEDAWRARSDAMASPQILYCPVASPRSGSCFSTRRRPSARTVLSRTSPPRARAPFLGSLRTSRGIRRRRDVPGERAGVLRDRLGHSRRWRSHRQHLTEHGWLPQRRRKRDHGSDERHQRRRPHRPDALP